MNTAPQARRRRTRSRRIVHMEPREFEEVTIGINEGLAQWWDSQPSDVRGAIAGMSVGFGRGLIASARNHNRAKKAGEPSNVLFAVLRKNSPVMDDAAFTLTLYFLPAIWREFQTIASELGRSEAEIIRGYMGWTRSKGSDGSTPERRPQA